MDPSQWDALVALIPPSSRRVGVLSGDPDGIRGRFVQIQPLAEVHELDPTRHHRDSDLRFDTIVIDRIGGGQPAGLQAFLEKIRPSLAVEGQLLLRFENAAHWTRLVGLLQGRTQPADGLIGTIEEMTAAIRAAGLEPFGFDANVQAADDLGQFSQLLAPALRAIGVEPHIFQDRASIASVILRVRHPGPPLRTLLIQTLIGEPLACARPRIHEPHRCLRTIPGVQIVSSEGAADLQAGEGFSEKIFIRQRHILRAPDDYATQRSLIEAGYLVIAEFDDDPERFPEIAEHGHLTFTACHAVQTSTEPLADLIRPWNPNVRVFPNQLLQLPDVSKPPAEPFVIFFGALNREADWAPLVPGLNRIAAEFGDAVRFQVVYDKAFFEALETASKAFEPFCPYPRYLELMGSSHVALLPLGRTRFNEHKSDLKFIEAASVGTVVLASPTVYAASVADGETGFLCGSGAEFEQALRRLLRDPGLLGDVGRRAREHVIRHRMQSFHYLSRYGWYQDLLARRDELTREIERRVPGLAGG